MFRFLETHKCNAVCRFLKLPTFNSKADCGTVPKQRIMAQDKIETAPFDAKCVLAILCICGASNKLSVTGTVGMMMMN